MPCSHGTALMRRTGSGGLSGSPPGFSAALISLFWTTTCIACVIRTGNARRRRTASSSSSAGQPFNSFAASRFAVATASCTARLTPTPPTGDIACAASPMQSRPGRVQRFRRLIVTVKSLTSSQLFTSAMPDFRIGAMPTMASRKASSPRALTASYSPFAMT